MNWTYGKPKSPLHTLLTRRLIFQLATISMLACAMVFVRVERTGRQTFVFMVWNLFLAWLPYLWALLAASLHRRHPGQWWRLLAPGVLWLLFFPNAPYMITDFVHLRTVSERTLWYDLILLTVFAWCGWILAVASLRAMQRLIESYLGRVAGWLFVLASALLGGWGVFIGRFLRWNSWDALVNPRALLADTLGAIANPYAVQVAMLFGAVFLIGYVMQYDHGGEAL